MWLLSTLILFLVVIWPTRSWEIAEDKSKSDILYDWNNQLREQISNFLPTCVINCFHKLTSWVKAIYKRVYDTLPLGLVNGALVFVAYYYVVVGTSEGVFRLWEKASLASADYATVFFIRPIASVLLFALRKSDFSKLHLGTLCVMLVFMVSMTYVCSMKFLIYFVITLTIKLQLAYGRSFAWLRWFFRIFVAFFCTKAIWHFFDIADLSLPRLLASIIATGTLYTAVDGWIHRETNNAMIIRDEFQVRYFQRGVARAQMKFVQQRLKVFAFIVGVTTLCAFGHVHPWPTRFEATAETTSTVFCKIDNTRQLECRVKTTYNDPYTSESEGCESDSQEWDYCGELIAYCR